MVITFKRKVTTEPKAMWYCYTSALLLLGQELMGLQLKKKKFRQEVSAEKGIRKYFLRERMVK